MNFRAGGELIQRKRPPKAPLRVLVISPHPDDLDFGCAGTLAVWARQGAEIFYTICTSGEKGSDDPAVTPSSLARTREKEQRAAAAVIGAREVAFLRKPDGELQYSLEFRGELVRMIRKYRPGIVISPDPANRAFDNQFLFHSDHRVVGELVFDAVYPAALNRNYYPEQLAAGLSPHAVTEIYFFGTAHPDLWVDIGPTMDLKIQALRCHTSQLQDPQRMEEMVRDWFAEWGREKGMAYAERFRRLPIYHDPGRRPRRSRKPGH